MSILLATEGKTLGEVMKEAVLPEDVNFLGLGVNPSFYSALIVTGVLLFAALILRIFVIPKFKTVPGKFQAILEWIVSFFSGIASDNSPQRNEYLGAFNFSAGLYIFFGTMIELVGIRAVLVDINGAIALALCAFGSIMIAGLRFNGAKGLLGTLKDFSLPLSMTFRLYGNMLSGLLVTDLVYFYLATSFVVPVIVGVLFTGLHAVIQTFIFVTLTSMFFGEAAEHHEKKKKKKNKEATAH
ncbi:MAG TPA: F0F1 ATP synthase subunit A [Clostridia bacterium]|nr:F0F1 ATP synthase subunit A [Clostridia bacterium]